MRYLAYLFWALIVFFGIIFAALNSTTIEIHYFFSTFKIYLPLLLVLQLFLGAALGAAAMLPLVIKSKQGSRKLKFRIKEIEQEVKNLRVIPIKDTH